MGKLEAAPADVGARIFFYGDFSIRGIGGSGFIGALALHRNEACKDEALRPLAARGEALLD